MSKPTLSRSPAAAIPILMRLPDLRQAKSAGSACAAVAADQPVLVALSSSLAETDVATEAATESELSIAPVQSPAMEAAASDDGKSVVSEATVVSAELPADEAAASASEIAESAAALAEPVVNAVPVKADVTNALPAESAAPVAPAAARRQRALERQRRQAAEPPRQQTWWTTHLPVIAIGFLVALVLTIYVGRRNRTTPANDSQAAVELPELEIDTGDGMDSLSPRMTGTETLAAAPPQEATNAGEEVKPTPVKSPTLLSAKPSIPEAEAASTETPRMAAKPGGNDVSNPYVSAPAAESVRAAAEMTSEASADYPSTEPAVYRPGGRVPRQARAPNYPQTSTPHLR